MKTYLRILASLALAHAALPLRAQDAAPGVSPHFAPASKYLDQGGVFFSYIDIDGDAAKFTGLGDAIIDLARHEAGGAIPPGLSATGILKSLGIDRVKAFGMSSRRMDGTLFQNRAVLLMPEGRAGLFKLFGGSAAPLQSPAFAPAGSDLVMESDITLSALTEVAESVLRSTGDDKLLQQFKGLLGFPVPGLDLTAGDFIAKLNTRLLIASRLEKGQTFTPPGSETKIPLFRLVISFDQLDFLFAPIKEYAKQTGKAIIEQGEGFEWIGSAEKAPEGMTAFQPLIYHDLKSKRILLGTHIDAIRECLAPKQPLSTDPAFLQATAGLPKEGNDFSYLTPVLYQAIANLMNQAMEDMPGGANMPSKDQMKELMTRIQSLSPIPTAPIAGIRANLPEGMIFHSNTTSSYKSLLALPVLFTGGMVAALGTGMYQGVIKNIRERSDEADEPAEPEAEAEAGDEPQNETAKSVRANLQQIAFAAQSHFVDNTDATEVTYEQLLADELLFRLEPVAGESYQKLKILKKGGTLSVTLKNGDTISRKYDPAAE
jgi:hypothetical protein